MAHGRPYLLKAPEVGVLIPEELGKRAGVDCLALTCLE